MKFSNAFTWDTNRADNTSPDTTSANITEMSRVSRPTTTTTRRSAAPSPPTQRDENASAGGTGGFHEKETEFTAHIQFPPVIRTTVEGQLKMEKSVGTHLRIVDHSIAKAYTIRDTTTHYRIRTKLGKREVVLEEHATATTDDSRNSVRSGGTYRLSVYEDGREISRNEAEIHVPDNMVSLLGVFNIVEIVDFCWYLKTILCFQSKLTQMASKIFFLLKIQRF